MKMAPLTIAANITAKADQVDLVKKELQKLAAKTHAEDVGCINYDLHQDNENPAHFLVFENWESKELLQQHVDSAHFKAYSAATEGAVETFTVNEMTRIK
jgi:quinol monooxygenase YgiN